MGTRRTNFAHDFFISFMRNLTVLQRSCKKTNDTPEEGLNYSVATDEEIKTEALRVGSTLTKRSEQDQFVQSNRQKSGKSARHARLTSTPNDQKLAKR